MQPHGATFSHSPCMTRAPAIGFFVSLLMPWTLLHATPSLPPAAESAHLEGDIGLGVSRTQNHMRGVTPKTETVPYLAFDDGRVFARVDSFGVRTLALGYGHVEVVGQWRSDGYTSRVLSPRPSSVPLGLGTLQITPVGAFWVQALHDFGKSGGQLVQAHYVAELKLGRLALYPELGVEYQSQAYNRYYHGTTAADAAALSRAYRPGAALNPFAGALFEIEVSPAWVATAYLRRTVVDTSIARSPLVTGRHRDLTLLSLARRF